MLTPTEITDFSRQAMNLVLVNSMPAMIGAAVAGLSIAILQALTQIQDQGLPTAVKFFAVMAVLYGSYLSIASSIGSFGELLFERISSL